MQRTQQPKATPCEPPAHERRSDNLVEALIDRIADRVVEKLEERRKIDLIAEAVVRHVRHGSHHQEATEEPDRASRA